MNVYINVKKSSSRKNSITKLPYEITLPVNTVKDFIEQIVESCVEEYNSRLENKELLHVLSISEMEDKTSEGKIAFGVNYGIEKARNEQALKDALQCFQDGIFRIYIGKVPCKALEEKINLSEDCEITFIKLTMLTGKMW